MRTNPGTLDDCDVGGRTVGAVPTGPSVEPWRNPIIEDPTSFPDPNNPNQPRFHNPPNTTTVWNYCVVWLIFIVTI